MNGGAAVVCAAIAAFEPASGSVVFAPTAFTLPAGRVQLSLVEVGVPTLAFGVTDDVEIGVAGTWIPRGEVLVGGGAKIVLDRRGPFSVAVLSGLGGALPEQNLVGGVDPGTVSLVPMFGGVMSFSRATEVPLDVHVSSTVFVPIVHGAADAVMLFRPGVEYAALPWLSIVGEVSLRAVVPRPQVGFGGAVAARFRFWQMAIDAGWLVDFGIVGPALPIVSLPGVPVMNLAVLL